MDLPATADAVRGGFAIDTQKLPSNLASKLTGTLRGYWGFAAFDGPEFPLRIAHPDRWVVPPAESGALVAGRDSTVHLQSESAACVDKVEIQNAEGRELKASWTLVEGDRLELTLPLRDQSAGDLKAKLTQFGIAKPDLISLHTFAEPAHLDAFAI